MTVPVTTPGAGTWITSARSFNPFRVISALDAEAPTSGGTVTGLRTPAEHDLDRRAVPDARTGRGFWPIAVLAWPVAVAPGERRMEAVVMGRGDDPALRHSRSSGTLRCPGAISSAITAIPSRDQHRQRQQYVSLPPFARIEVAPGRATSADPRGRNAVRRPLVDGAIASLTWAPAVVAP